MSVRHRSELAAALPEDRLSGIWGMKLFMLTEAALFLVLFFAYFFLATQNPTWPMGEPPKLVFVLPMTVLLVASSVLLHLGERSHHRDRPRRARGMLTGATLLGAAFVVVQVFEYRDHLRTLTPQSNAYGSIFYTITSFHALHLLLGLAMLAFALLLAWRGPTPGPPAHVLRNVAAYWHFVDGIWLIIVALLYVAPNLGL